MVCSGFAPETCQAANSFGDELVAGEPPPKCTVHSDLDVRSADSVVQDLLDRFILSHMRLFLREGLDSDGIASFGHGPDARRPAVRIVAEKRLGGVNEACPVGGKIGRAV